MKEKCHFEIKETANWLFHMWNVVLGIYYFIAGGTRQCYFILLPLFKKVFYWFCSRKWLKSCCFSVKIRAVSGSFFQDYLNYRDLKPWKSVLVAVSVVLSRRTVVLKVIFVQRLTVWLFELYRYCFFRSFFHKLESWIDWHPLPFYSMSCQENSSKCIF